MEKCIIDLNFTTLENLVVELNNKEVIFERDFINLSKDFTYIGDEIDWEEFENRSCYEESFRLENEGYSRMPVEILKNKFIKALYWEGNSCHFVDAGEVIDYIEFTNYVDRFEDEEMSLKPKCIKKQLTSILNPYETDTVIILTDDIDLIKFMRKNGLLLQ